MVQELSTPTNIVYPDSDAQEAENARKTAITRLLKMGLTPKQVAQALNLPIEKVLEDDSLS